MGKKTILTYWVLLLVPTLVIGAAALWLLRHEQERLTRASVDAARQQAMATAGTIALALSDVKDGFIRSLEEIPEHQTKSFLSSWERDNPLVRQVFIWDPGAGLLYPPQGSAGTAAERQFAGRYEIFFSGQRPWPYKTDATEQIGSGGSGQATLSPLESRRKLSKLARAPAVASDASQGPADVFQSGWIPWFFEDRLHLLGWVRRSQQSRVIGVELELMTLLARLLPVLPKTAGPGTILALMDGQGRLLYQTAGAPIASSASPAAYVSLAPDLPHWQVGVFFSEGAPSAAGHKGFFVVSALLLAVFLVAILSGGGLITWQAIRHQRDAREKTSFVSNVSHELKTPLTSIRMYAELLADGRVAGSEKQQRYLNVIVEESQRLTRLVNNVLDFGRLEQGRKTYTSEPLDLTEWIRDFLRIHRVRLVAAGIAVETFLPDKPVTVNMDRDALDQVLLNLVDNAIKYAAEGGHLGIGMVRSDARWTIRVEDRGPGIPESCREKIFEKFRRLDDSLTARQPGSGLGLSIARRLMRDMGGDLNVERVNPRGSRFQVLLPGPADFKE